MTEPLFEIKPPESVQQRCEWCHVSAWATGEALRARGWLVYDGVSVTGQPLHVRICPPCQKREAAKMRRSGTVLRSAGLPPGHPATRPAPPPP